MDNPGVMEDIEQKTSVPRVTRKAAESKPHRFNRWVRRAAYAVAALLGLWLVAWLGLPPLLKWQAQKIASEQLGREVTIGKVEFKPWSLELSVHDLVIAGAEGAEPQLRIGHIYADAEMESLWRLAPVLDAVRVEAPQLKFTHLGEGRYDFDDILARFAATAAPDEPDGKPARFALYNIELQDGSVDFRDEAVSQTHEVRDLRLTLPFISNLPSKVEIKVLPQLAFVANGSHFDSIAQALPFTDSRETDASFQLIGLDLAPYLGYVPAGLPVKLKAATVDTNLKVGFEQNPNPSLRVEGNFEVSGLKAVDTAGTEALAFDGLKVALADVRPLEQKVHLSLVELHGPQIHVTRDKHGRINLLLPAEAGGDEAEAEAPQAGSPQAGMPQEESSPSEVEPASDSPQVASVPVAPTVPAGQPAVLPWNIQVDRLIVNGGHVAWTDELPGSPGQKPAQATQVAQLDLQDLEIEANSMVYPFAEPMQFRGSARLQGAAPASVPVSAKDNRGESGTKAASDGAANAPSLQFEGTATDRAAQVQAQVTRLPLLLAEPYLSSTLAPRLTGHLDAQLGLDWAAPEAPDGAAAITVTSEKIVLDDLRLAEKGRTGAKASTGKRQARSPRASEKQLASIRKIELLDAQVDLLASSVKVGKLSVVEPKLDVERDAKGRWMYESWLRTDTGSGSGSGAASGSQSQAPWNVLVEQLAVSGGAVGWRDAAMGAPVRADLTQLRVDARALDLAAGKPMPVTLSARLGSGRTEPGRLSWRGTVGTQPLALRGDMNAQRLPVHAFEPYFGDALNIDILRADASFKGQVSYSDSGQGPRAKVQGDVLVEELRTHSRPNSATDTTAPEEPAAGISVRAGGTTTRTAMSPARPTEGQASVASQAPVAPAASTAAGGLGEELLSWKLLKLAGLDLALEPGQPVQVDVKNTLLSDFYARLIIHQNGRINLQDLVKGSPDESIDGPEAGGTSVAAAGASGTAGALAGSGSMPAAGENSAGAGDTAVAPAAVQQAAAVDPNAPVIRFGPIELANGRVLFSDRFIRPNYSADLSELNGSLSAFSSTAPSGAPEMADLRLTGRAEGSASLEVSGKLNPLAKPLALDIEGRVRDLELPPLSPYSVKYAGHGIERGKLSVDVAYTVQPDGRLTASNRLVLNQLEFGEPVAGAPASLPVKLATALLADSKGVIDLDLPISGSLNDPQFSLGPIIFKAVINLIGRAITAPFSLLARALGGGSGDDLAQVTFSPGSSELTDEARARLDKVAQALQDRPALKLTVMGTADLESERQGWRRQRLQALVAAEKRSGSGGGPVALTQTEDEESQTEAPAAAQAGISSVSEAEYPALLRRVYRRADLPGKPRNAIGMTKDIPVAEMEALLMAHIDVTEDAMRQLAVQRGVAVKDYLASQDLPAERLFLGAPRTGRGSATQDGAAGGATSAASASPASSADSADGTTAKAGQDRWTPRAELSLSAR